MWDIDQMKPLSATVVLSLFTPSFSRSTASSGRFNAHHYSYITLAKTILEREKTPLTVSGSDM